MDEVGVDGRLTGVFLFTFSLQSVACLGREEEDCVFVGKVQFQFLTRHVVLRDS